MIDYLKYVFCIVLSFGAFCALSEKPLSREQVLQELLKAYTQSKYISKTALYSLEVRLAEATLERVKRPLTPSSQDHKLKDEVLQAIYLYKKALNRVAHGEEKSKILFRIGYLYEMLAVYSQALDSYKQVLSVSRDHSRISKARTLSLQMEKKLEDVDKTIDDLEILSENEKTLSPLDLALSRTKHYLTSRRWKQAVSSFDRACQVYLQNQSCNHNACRHSPEVVKNLIYMAHGERMSKNILQLYNVYLSYFPMDSVMVLSAAEWASRMGQYDQSLNFYQRHILFEQRFIKFHLKANERKEKFIHLENLFHLYHSLAQLSQDPRLEIQAYDFYLKHSVLRKSVFEIRYLKNKALFRIGRYSQTAPVFREIALSAYPDERLRGEAAVFALKALSHLNQTAAVKKWVYEFSHSFPHKKDEFRKFI